ncbi:hypothetical protein K8942_03445 [Candidatus Peribacteria bacterium]|nr:MAG: hypothetical protein K8942_03445 [Candidatus Peribacteria bacterium]
MDNTPNPTQILPTPPLDDVQENKDIAALGYVWILSVFVYFWKKDSPFVRFHAKQGIVLFILSILLWAVPIAGRFLELLILALMVLGFLGAAQGQWKDLPIIGDMASGRWSHVRQSWKDIVQSIASLWRRLTQFIRKEKERAAATKPVDETPVTNDTSSNPNPPTPSL